MDDHSNPPAKMTDEDNLEQPIIQISTYDGPRNEVGERHGRGRCVYPNKDVYVGNFEKGLRTGAGTYRWAYLGITYRGEYKEGNRNGRGLMRYANGTVYEGEFVDSMRQGYGRMEYPNLDYYEGEWLKGLPHGQGKYYYRSCDAVAQGTFEYGRIIRGELVLRDGSKWIGGFRLNQPFGEGHWENNGWVQEGKFIEINPPEKEPEDEAQEEAQEDDIEKSIEEEMAEDQEKIDELKEKQAQEEQDEKEANEDEEEGEKPDPREKTLKALLPPKRIRKTLKYELPKKKDFEEMRTLKLRWVPKGLPKHE